MHHTIDLVGVGVFAISGALAAGRKRLDLFGVLVLALVTSVGGGTLRDVLLNRQIVWLHDPAYLIIIVSSALLTVTYAQWRRPPEMTLVIADALGLALFSVAGAQIAQRAGLPAVSGVALGTMTGSAGGAIRDILSAQVPLVLQRGDLYASAAIAGTSVYFILDALKIERSTAALAGMAVVAAVRFAAIWWRLQLPIFDVNTVETSVTGPP